MLIDRTALAGLPILEPKNDPPVGADGYRPKALIISGRRVRIERLPRI